MEPAKRWMRFSAIALLVIIAACKQPNNKPAHAENSTAAKPATTQQLPQRNDADTSTKRTIYLTFDDGPNAGTPVVMDILKQEGLPATFFLIGMHVNELPHAKQYLAQLRAMPNVELCNHSYTHGYKNHFEQFYADVTGSEADFKNCADSVGFNNNIVRTPGNNIWRTPMFRQTTYARYKPAADNLADSGFIAMGWDAEWRYRSLKLCQTPDQMVAEIDSLFSKKENRRENHCVLLMHDLTFKDTSDSTHLLTMLTKLKADGRYRFDVASNHPFVKPYDERRASLK